MPHFSYGNQLLTIRRLTGQLVAFWAMMMVMITPVAVSASEAGWVGDLPVPADTLIETQSAVTFDSPSGRVVQFYFRTAANQAEVTSFFDRQLGELGWQKQGDSFTRGAERLQIESAEMPAAGIYRYQLLLGPVK